jgi:hypothetical protein
MRKAVIVLGIVASMAHGTSALAGPLPDGGVTVDEVAAALQAKGFKAEISKDSGGDPLIRSAADGSNFSIYFYSCDKAERCVAIQFSAGFDLAKGTTLEVVNSWNKDRRFGKAYLDADKDPYLEYDIDVEHGATTEALENVVDVWESVLPTFKKHIDF